MRARLRELQVPRSLVLLACTLVLSAPAGWVIADNYRTADGAVIHQHTSRYTTYNGIGSGDPELAQQASEARADWHNAPTAILGQPTPGFGAPNSPVHAGTRVHLLRDSTQSNAAVVWQSNHDTTHAHIVFDPVKTGAWGAFKKQWAACNALGNVFGLADRNATDATKDCMGTVDYTAKVGSHSVKMIDDFYGPNISLSGSLAADDGDVSASRDNQLTAAGYGHAIKSVEILVDNESKAYEEQAPCPGFCTLRASYEAPADSLPEGQHTIRVVVTNEFGNQEVRESKVFAEQHAGKLPHYTFEDEALSDRATASVNVANGNLVLEERDLQIAGTGLDLALARYWNSQTRRETDLGSGWSFGTGDGVELKQLSDGDVRFFGPSGYAVRFNSQEGGSYSVPSALNATLTKRNQNPGWELEFYESEERYVFDGQGRLIEDIDRNDQKISFAYDAAGRITRITDTQGRPVTFEYYPESDPEAGGLIRAMTDVAGRRFEYLYDDRRLIRYITPDTTDSDVEYGYTQGRLTDIYDARAESGGYHTAIRYDGTSQRVASVTRAAAADGSGPWRTRFAYDTGDSDCTDDADPGKTDDDESTTVTDPRGNVTTYCTDEKSRVTEIRDAMGHKVEKTYSAKSNIETYSSTGGDYKLEYSTVQGHERLALVKGPGGATTNIQYSDPSARPSSVTDPQGNTTNYAYDGSGNLTSVRNPSFQEPLVRLEYNDGSADPDLKGTLEWSELEQGPTTPASRTNYRYDGEGNLIEEMPPKGPNGEVLQGSTSYGYSEPNVAGTAQVNLSRVTSVTAPGTRPQDPPITRRISYDAFDRVTEIAYPGPDDSVCYSYDGAGNMTERLDGCDDQGASDVKDRYVYDGRNLPTEDILRSGRRITYAYDAAANLIAMTELKGATHQRTVTYTYNADNLVETIQDPAVPGSYSYTYNDEHQVKTLTYPNGMVLDNTYEDTRLLDSKVTKGTGTLSHLQYRYDHPVDGSASEDDMTDLVYQVKDLVQGLTTNYSYDKLNRLTSADESASTGASLSPHDYAYQYDDASNLTRETVDGNQTNYSYNLAHELERRNGTLFQLYDHNGNLGVEAQGNSYRYDQRNRTVGITPPASAEIPFDYADASQQERLRKGMLEFTDSQLGLIAQDPQDTGSTNDATYFTRNPDSGEVVGMRTPGGSFYFITDRLGTVTTVADQAGQVVRRYRYEPYGEAVEPTGAKPPSAPSDSPIRFQNQYLDEDTGLYKMGVRYYEPSTARWTQLDPLNLFQDPRQGNRYAFAGADPVNHIDPTGALFDLDISFSPEEGLFNAIGIIGGTAACGVALASASAVAPVAGTAIAAAGCLALDVSSIASLSIDLLDEDDDIL